MTIGVSALCGLFSNLKEEVVREVIHSQQSHQPGSNLSLDFVENRGIVVKHLLLLSPEHWMQAIITEAERKPLMVILRGLPGSGKSTIAKALQFGCQDESSSVIVSADDFFLDESGNYSYIPTLIEQAHIWSQTKTRSALNAGKKLVIVDNTNMQSWEMLPYCKMAGEKQYSLVILEPKTSWKQDAYQLSRKTKHGVPMEKIKNMKKKMEPNLTAIKLCSNLPLKFKPHCLSLDDLLQKESNSGTNGDRQSSPTVGKNNNSEDFQSLLQCFPDLPLDSIYLPFLRHNGNVSEAVHSILESTKNDEEIKNSDTTTDGFEMVLDAQFAAELESSFGNVRSGFNFPGALKLSIPKSLAEILHVHWKQQVEAQLTKDYISELLMPEIKISPSSSSSASPTPSLNSLSLSSNKTGSLEDANNGGVKVLTKEELRGMREKRSELYEKAAAAFKAKKGGVAAYYSDEGRKITERINKAEANLRYQDFLAANTGKNCNSLDLHGLTVNEAVENLEWFLDEKYERMRYNKSERVKVEVITGKGSKSKAKIKPSIKAYLERNEIKFSENNPGSFEIVLKL